MAEVAEIELPGPKMRALFEVLQGRGDVEMRALYAAINGPPRFCIDYQRQQWLGPYIRRLNRRLARHRLAVKPGDLKRTYRLVVV